MASAGEMQIEVTPRLSWRFVIAQGAISFTCAFLGATLAIWLMQ